MASRGSKSSGAARQRKAGVAGRGSGGSKSARGAAKNAKKRGGGPKLQLERVLGMTCFHNGALTMNHVTGDIAYPAGCIVVVYNPRRNRQVRFFKARQAVSCVSFSPSGKLIAIGERGKKPSVRVFELSSGKEVANLQQHKYGVRAVAFTPDDQFLVSIGFQHDRGLYVWDWRRQTQVAMAKVAQQMNAVAISADGKRMVTCGARHVKFWSLEGVHGGKSISLSSRPAIMASCQDSTFVDVACGVGAAADCSYAVTSDGVLCCFDSSRVMGMWVEAVKSGSAFGVAVTNGAVAVACGDGIIRLFEPATLAFKLSLPRPPPLGCANEGLSAVQSLEGCRPATLCVSMTMDSQKVVGVYGDRSLFMWDIQRPSRITKYRSFMFHSAAVWDVQVAPDDASAGAGALPPDTFVTCSSDSTVRFWNINRKPLAPPADAAGAGGAGGSKPSAVRAGWEHLNNTYCKELLHVLYAKAEDETLLSGSALIGNTDESDAAAATSASQPLPADSLPAQAVIQGPFNVEMPPKLPVNVGVRCIGMRPGSADMVTGDRQGTLRVYDTGAMRLSCVVLAHESEVMSVDFSPLSGRLLASGSRDRLVHVFDARTGYRLRETLDHHSSSITAVRFSRDDAKLLSCGGDKSIVMCKVEEAPDVQGRPGEVTVRRSRSVTVPYGTIYDMAVDATNRNLVTGGQDKHLNVWSVNNGKPLRSYKTDAACQEINRVALDPAGIFAATCSFDKGIRLFDFFSGNRLARVSAHSEMVTGVTFTQDCRRLITVGADGCIMVWRVSEDLTKAMHDRLAELSHRLTKPPAAAAAAIPRAPATPSSVDPPPEYLARVDARSSAAQSQRTKLMQLLNSAKLQPGAQTGDGGNTARGPVAAVHAGVGGVAATTPGTPPRPGDDSVTPKSGGAPRPMSAESPDTGAGGKHGAGATGTRGIGSDTVASSFALDMHKSMLPAWAKSTPNAPDKTAPHQRGSSDGSIDTGSIGSAAAVRTGGFARRRGGSAGAAAGAAGAGHVAAQPPPPPATGGAGGAGAGAEPPAVPQSKWAQRVGKDGYAMFGGAVQVRPGDDDDDSDVLMATLDDGGTPRFGTGTGGQSNADADDDDQNGEASFGIADDAADDGGDGDADAGSNGDAGEGDDVVQVDGQQAELSQASFTVTTDNGALLAAMKAAAEIRAHHEAAAAAAGAAAGAKSPSLEASDQASDGGARTPVAVDENVEAFRRAVEGEAAAGVPAAGTTAGAGHLRATLSSTFYRAHTAAAGVGGASLPAPAVSPVAPPPVPARTTGPSARDAVPRSSLERALALKALDTPPAPSPRSLQQERDAARFSQRRQEVKEQVGRLRASFEALNRSASANSIWDGDEAAPAAAAAAAPAASTLPAPTRAVSPVRTHARNAATARRTVGSDKSPADDATSSLEALLLNATSTAAAEAADATQAANDAAVRASQVAQESAGMPAPATSPLRSADAEAGNTLRASRFAAPVASPIAEGDEARTSTAGAGATSGSISVSPVNVTDADAVVAANTPGRGPPMPASFSPERGTHTPVRRGAPPSAVASRASALPRPLAAYRQSVASLRAALGNVMSLYHELEAAGLQAEADAAVGATQADDAAATAATVTVDPLRQSAMALMRSGLAEVRQSLALADGGMLDGAGAVTRGASSVLLPSSTSAARPVTAGPTLVAVGAAGRRLSLSYARPATAAAPSGLQTGSSGGASGSSGEGAVVGGSSDGSGRAGTHGHAVSIDVASILEHFSGMLCDAVQQRMQQQQQ